ncbi:hypothetical protein N0V88_006922 [Collariella sp. IMI 366227]|nr:hypothetical protein N0V88_006922 [Collariella sp. IMI 366227]
MSWTLGAAQAKSNSRLSVEAVRPPPLRADSLSNHSWRIGPLANVGTVRSRRRHVVQSQREERELVGPAAGR